MSNVTAPWDTWLWFLVTTIVAALVGWLVNWRQTLQTEKRLKAQSAAADLLRKERDLATQQRNELDTRITVLEDAANDAAQKLALMSQTIQPIYEAMKQTLIKSLTHPSAEFREGDDLLAKVADENTIPSAIEMARLEQILKIRETDPNPEITASERLAAKILPDMIKLVAIEKNTLDAVTKLQVVTITEKPKPTDETEE